MNYEDHFWQILFEIALVAKQVFCPLRRLVVNLPGGGGGGG